MNSKYVAAKLVRFDRSYDVGEVIPNEVISPKTVKRLIGMGKISVVPAINEEPPKTFLGGDLETCVGYVERILGIDHGDTPPDIDTRAELCKTRLAEIEENRTSETIPAATGGDGEPGGSEQPENPEGGETAESEADSDGDEIPAQEEPEGGNAGGDDVANVCQICGKVCASNAGLKTHMKTHNT